MGSDSPDGWKLVRFGDLLTESRVSGSKGSDPQRLSIKLYGNGVVPKINDRQGSSATRYYRRAKGQLIYSKLDFLNGALGIIPDELDGYESTLDLPAFDIAPDVDTEWLISVLTRPAFYRRYRHIAIGSRKARRVPVDEFLASAVTVPSPREQQAIADVFHSLNEAIARTQSLLDRLSRAKHAVMRELLTIGHPAYRDKLMPLPEAWRIGRVAPDIERMPKHWRLVTLTKFARLESGHTPSRQHPEYWDGDIPWLSLGDTSEMKKLRVETTSEAVTQAGIDNSSARLLPTDTVVLSRTAVRGLCSRLGKPMATSQDFVAFVCGPDLRPDYLMQLFRHMQREWKRLEQGSSPTNKTLYFAVFKKLKVLLPPLEEQDAIAAVGEGFDERILAEQRYLDQLGESKRGLAQALLSGRVRVSTTGRNRKAKARSAGGS
jgi:type I restriction enzyme S subunit